VLHLTVTRANADGPQPFKVTASMDGRATAWFGVVADLAPR
jgi:hypothetical protein